MAVLSSFTILVQFGWIIMVRYGLAHPEVARRIFDRIIEEMADVSTVEQSYRMEGRTMNIILAPKVSKADLRPASSSAPEPPSKGK